MQIFSENVWDFDSVTQLFLLKFEEEDEITRLGRYEQEKNRPLKIKDRFLF